MAFRETSDFDAPVPGMSLTHEIGARPWQTPPEFVSIEEALDYYIPRLTDTNYMGRLIDIIETKIPLTSIADTLTLGGVMQGLHTIDVAVLVNPILVELMEGIAKNAEVDYVVGDDEGIEDAPDSMLIKKAMEKIDNIDISSVVEPEKNTDVENASSGLMSRRGEN
jgi:hypothetical protein